MKLTTPFLAAAMLASSVQACIRIHTLMAYNPQRSLEDSMKVQIWDNDNFYEVQRQVKFAANRDTHWQFAFGNGHYVELWDDGKVGFVSLPGMFVTLPGLKTNDFSHLSLEKSFIRVP
jgi:hypothetical protein